MQGDQAREALEAARGARQRLAERTEWPLSYHLGFATVMAGFVALYALPLALRFVAIALLCGAVAMMIREQQRRGLFVNGYRMGRTAWVTYPLVSIGIAAQLAGAVL